MEKCKRYKMWRDRKVPLGLLGAGLLALCLTLVCSCKNAKNPGELSGTGTIEVTEVNLSSKVSGNVLKRYVDEGSEVKDGDSIAEIDHTVYDLQLAQAQSALAMAKANLAAVSDNYFSTLKLYKQGTATQKQKEQLTAAYGVAQAQINQAQAAVNLAEQMIAYCHIVSPVAGVVTHKLIEEGELAGPGTPIVTVSVLEQVKLTIYITEPELGKVKIGQAAEATIDSYPKKIFPGKVIYISPEAEFTPKNIQTKEERVKLVYGVKIEIPNPEGILKASMPADATIKTEK